MGGIEKQHAGERYSPLASALWLGVNSSQCLLKGFNIKLIFKVEVNLGKMQIRYLGLERQVMETKKLTPLVICV